MLTRIQTGFTMNGATYSQASFHVELPKCVRRARGDQWTINFAKRLAVVSPNNHALQRALALIRVRQFLPRPRRSLRPISIRGAGSAILLNARTTLSGLSVVILVTRSPRVTCGTQVSTHAERASKQASKRASGRAGGQVQLQVSLPTAAVGFARAWVVVRRASPAFLPALIAFFLRPTPILLTRDTSSAMPESRAAFVIRVLNSREYLTLIRNFSRKKKRIVISLGIFSLLDDIPSRFPSHDVNNRYP